MVIFFSKTSWIKVLLFMGNKVIALEWLSLAEKHLEAARILMEANHFTDVIGLELHQSLEKMLKSIHAYNNQRIEKTHDLVLLLGPLKNMIQINEHWLDLCDAVSEYYRENRYPGPVYEMPSRAEIQEVYEMATEWLCTIKTIIST